MRVAAIIPAAGLGRRMRQAVPKQYLQLADKPILAHTLEVFERLHEVDEITLVAQPAAMEFCQNQVITPYGFKKVFRLVPGGKERQDSVYNALKILHQHDDLELILVHDGVRPFVTPKEIRRVLAAARQHGAAILALPVQDTVKVVDQQKNIKQTLDRRQLWLAQTPQVFQTAILWRAFIEAYSQGFYGTDEASLVEALGLPVAVVPGSPFNIKVTTPEDLILAQAIYEIRQKLKKEPKATGTLPEEAGA